MDLEVIGVDLTVCKVASVKDLNLNGDLFFIGRTDEEVSVVCATKDVPQHTTERVDGWKGFRVRGELDFSLTGILAKIAGILADHEISIFAVSTYNTDYILVKSECFDDAMNALAAEGYTIIE